MVEVDNQLNSRMDMHPELIVVTSVIIFLGEALSKEIGCT